ncbi:MAG: AMP-binding protein [Vicinamibacterales bacterium]
MTRTVHRLIENHAALRGDAIALVDGESSCSYRELNAAANVLARKLMNAGFRRGTCAHVSMPARVELAVVLLAILKAGGCYTWSDPGPGEAASIWFEGGGGPERELEIGEVPRATPCGGSNLPVMSRETDAACVLHGGVIVPHATIIAMTSCAAGARSPFTGEPGAFDLWVPLMNGATAVVEERSAVAA